MEMLQNVWNALTTENEVLTKIIFFPFAFIEVYVLMKFFTTVMNINYTQKQRNLYFGIMSIFSLLSLYILPKNISLYINIILLPVTIKFSFKQSILKSIVAQIISLLTVTLLELFFVRICIVIFKINPNNSINVPIFRTIFATLNYLAIFLISFYVKILKFDFNIFDKINTYHKRLILLNLFFILISIGSQFYLFAFCQSSIPMYITLTSLISLIVYSVISIYSILKTINLEITKTTLEQSQLHNKTLELLYNNMRAFKHDFYNIIAGFGGYIYTKDVDGLSKYYDQVLDECHINNNLSTLNPEIINNPAIYNILATKYYKADELDIKISLNVFIDLNELKMNIYDFCRILGILLDNAIEAASQCEEKIVKIEIRDFKQKNCQTLTIENTYLNKDIEISKLFEKGYTSKTEDKENHGIGLWQVSKTLKKHNNVLLDTSKTEEFFKQELAIYYK